ncbi:MAG: DUF3179 domain-containing protein [Acidobacteria bacterium]|nr:DUF3179 domain-containing protein [Acidobacteriota bacterium]
MRLRVIAPLVLTLTVSACAAPNVDDPRREPKTRDGLPHITEVENDPVHTLLAPDAIPAIDEPEFVRAADATFMDDDEPVIGVVLDGVARAYSTWHLDRHEIVNDTIASKPLAVTW